MNAYIVISASLYDELKERHNVLIQDRYGNTNGDYSLEKRSDGKYDLSIWIFDSDAKIEIMGLEEPPLGLLVRVDSAVDDPAVEYVLYVDPIEMEKAKITLPTEGSVFKIFSCEDFDVLNFMGNTWEVTDKPFTEEEGTVSFEVEHFSAYGVAEAYNSYTVANTKDFGEGSLRQAILDANINLGLDKIVFDIPSDDENHYYYQDDGVTGHITQSNRKTTGSTSDSLITDIDPDYPYSWWSIKPQSALPVITDPVIVDGYSQKGAIRNTLIEGNTARLTIEIDGSTSGLPPGGLSITGGESTVRGLVINNFGLCGIQIENEGKNVIEGNYIGCDVSGSIAGGNFIGVNIFDSSQNRIGGDSASASNVIMGNRLIAVLISGDSSMDNEVQGNYIGNAGTANTDSGSGESGVWVAKEVAAENLVEDNQDLENLKMQKSTQFIIFDTSVENYVSLVKPLLLRDDTESQSSSSDEVFILDIKKDGIEQITDRLSQHSDVEAVHIFSHGSIGNLKLGNANLGYNNMDYYASQLGIWDEVLADDADILLYGCNVAEGELGVEFIERLSQLTGADIAASDDPTGYAELGGDWELEENVGEIEASNPIPDSVLEEYNCILGENIITDTPLADYKSDPTLTSYAKDSFVNGLGEMASLLGEFTEDGSELNSSLLSAVPGLLDYSISDDPKAPGLWDLLNDISLSNLFQGTFVDQIQLNFSAGQKVTDFVTFLEGLDNATIGTYDITVAVLADDLTYISGDDYELWFKISFTVKQTSTYTYTLDIGRNGDLIGLTTDHEDMPDVELEIGFTFNITLGTILTLTEGNFSGNWSINDTKVETTNNDFFLRDTELAANAKIDESDLADFELLVGFLKIFVKDATFVLDADMDANLVDPDNADGKNRITLNELTTTSASALVDIDSSGFYSIVLPVNISNIPSTTFAYVFYNLSLFINLSGDPFDPFAAPSGEDDPRTAPKIELSPEFREYVLVFNNVLPDGVMGLLDQLQGWFGSFGVSQIFSAVEVPFADGKTLADVMDFFSGLETLINNSHISSTDEDDITTPNFISFQEFAEDLDDAIDLDIGDILPHYDRELKHLVFTIEVNPVLPDILEVPIDFNVDLGDLGNIETSIQVNLTPTVDISLTIGIDISSLTEVIINSESADFGIRALINSSTGLPFTPTNGVLTNDTKFKLTIGSLGSIDVDLWASNTSSNTNLSELIDDLQAVINAELQGEDIDAVIEVREISGDRLGLFTDNTSFMKIENNSVTDSESKGGFELLGFWDGHIGSTSPTPVNGVISGDARFDLTLGTTVHHVFLDKDNTTNNDIGGPTDKNLKINQLVGDIANAIASTLGGVSGLVDVIQLGDGFSITLGTTPQTFIHISNASDVAFKELGIPKNQIAAEIQILGERYLSIEGNPLSSSLVSDGILEEDATIDLEIDDEPVSVTVHASGLCVLGFVCNQFATGNLTAPYNITDSGMYGHAPGVDISFKLTIDGEGYVVTVPKSITDLNGNIGALVIDFNTAFATAIAADGSTQDITSNVTADEEDGKRLKFIPTNLSHTLLITSVGNTQDNEDLLDLVNDLSEALGREKLSDGTPLDRVIIVGIIGENTDLDPEDDEFSLALSIPSAPKDKLEITDTDGDLNFFVTSATVYGPRADGEISSDATFSLTLDEGSGLASYDVEVDFSLTSSNNNISDLAEDINVAFTTAEDDGAPVDISGKVVAGIRGNRITFAVTNKDAKLLKVTDTNNFAEQQMGLTDGVIAQAREKRGRLFIKDVSLGGGVNLIVSPTAIPAAEAHFGFVGIEVEEIKGALSGYGTDVAVHGGVTLSLGGITSVRELTAFKLPVLKNANIDLAFENKIYPVTLLWSQTQTNANINDLASDLWKAINDTDAYLVGKIVVGTDGDRLTLSAPGKERMRLSVDPDDEANKTLGFATGQQVGPIYLGDLSDAVTDFDILKVLVDIDISGSASLLLANISLQLSDVIENLIDELGINPSIYINMTDFTNFSTISIDPIGLGAISDGFDDLNFSSIIDGLQSLLDLLLRFSMFDFLDEPLPIIGITLNETLQYIEDFLDFLDELENNPAAIVQDLDQLLKEALGLPSDSDLVSLSLDTSSSTILRINLSYGINYSASLPVQIDLLNLLGISLPSGLEDLANLSGAAGLEAEFTVELTLGLGIDLDDLTIYLYDNTGVNLEGYAAGKNVNFVASLGPFGLFITGGNAVFNEDGDPNSTNPAYFRLSAFDDPDDIPNGDKIELTGIDIQAELAAGIGAILPCYFPTASNFIGNLDFDVSLDLDIGDPEIVDVTANLKSTPDFTNLPDLDDFNLIESLLLVVEGLDLVLAILENVLSGEFGKIDVPLIGDSLSDAADFIENVRGKVIPKLRDFIENAPTKAIELVQKAIFNALGPPGLGLLKLTNDWHDDGSGNTNPDYRDVQYIFPDNMTELQFNLWLGDNYAWETPEIDFGLPGLGLDMDGGITVAFDWNLLLAFGISMDDGFYIDTSPWDEFTDHFNGTPDPPLVDGDPLEDIIDIRLSVGLPESITGKLLFLQLEIKNRDITMENPDKKSLVGSFSVDVEGGGDDDRLTFAEIPSVDLDFSFGVYADIDLDLTLGIVGGGKWPSIESEFYMRWGLGDEIYNGSSDPLQNHYKIPWIGFYNVSLNLGSFFSDFLRPIIESIQTITEPLQPLVDILTAPIPVISDLAGEDITLIDIAGMFGVVDPSFIYAIADLITMINSIPTDAGDILIKFGDFAVGGDGTLDLRDENALDLIRNSPSSSSLSDLIKNNFGDDFGDLADVIDDFDFGGALDQGMSGSGASSATKGFAKSTTKEGGGWSFPIFQDAGQVFGLLMGRPADVIVYDMPKFIFDFTYSQYFPIWDGLGAEITGSLGVIIDLSFGYDTYGIQEFAAGGWKHPLDLLKGFYIGDLDLESGADIPEVTIYGSLTGAAVLNIVVAKVGVGGGIYATIDFNLNDPDGDGKIRIEEIWGNIVNGFKQLGIPLGLICIFDISGRVEARLFAFVELLWGLWEKTWYFGPALPLIEFSYTCPKDPILAKLDEDTGVLRLNMGEFAEDRLYGDTTDGAELFKVKLKSGNTVKVWSDRLGVSENEAQEHSGVTKIVAKAGENNDIVDLHRVTSSSITAELKGETGNDVLIAGKGSALLEGGLGDDVLVGGDSDDELYGEIGNDKLIGNGGDDLLEGGSENDQLNGDAQPTASDAPHTLRGTQGGDKVYGGEGDDILAGGVGEDILQGGDGEDRIWGDSSMQYVVSDYSYSLTTNGNGKPDLDPDDPSIGDADHITGDADADEIYGEGGNDFISGGGAPDILRGDGGSDKIWGDSGFKFNSSTKLLEKNATGDPITVFPFYGKAAGDNITGGEGGDWIFGEDGNDELHGDEGRDFIWGTRGSDVIYGNDGNDDLYGGTGNDRMFGNDGADLVKGEADNDVMFGDDGEVYLVPNKRTLNYDLIKTVSPTTVGDDFMNGDVGDDILLGGPGKDTMNGGDGNDYLIGDNGEFDFTWYGSMGGSLIDLFESTDLTVGDEDIMYGGEGEDIAVGGKAGDEIYGDADELGTDGEDVLIGDNGKIDFVPDPDAKKSAITLIETTDTIPGSGGDDYIDGSENADIILGGVGSDDITGGLDDDIIVGDSGMVDFDTGDGDLSTVDLIQTTDNIIPVDGDVDDISGGEADDTILGGDAGDNIWGDDSLTGTPTGDPGEDIIVGDQGKLVYVNGLVDTIEATDTQLSDGGNDTIEGNQLRDIIIGGVAGDILDGATGDDVIIGDEGILKFNLASGAGGDDDPTTLDFLNTTKPDLGAGDDIEGDEGEDVILGGAGGDAILGADADDVILGDNGELTMPGEVIDLIESIFPSYGSNDTIEGNDGDDIILGGTAGDYIWGHDDNDMILGDNGMITMPDEVIEVVETTYPTIGGEDIIEGNAGDDYILGGAKGDFIWGNTGDEVILGDNGRLDFVVDLDADTLDLIETTDPSVGGIDTIEGNEDADTILGGPYGDYIWGHEADDMILGDSGKVTQPGEIVERIETTDPAIGGADIIEGNEGSDYILGGADGDDIWGNDGHDVILGDNGFLDWVYDGDASTLDLIISTDPSIGGGDTIEGNAGDDTIRGVAEGDDIWGHTGEDIILGDNGNITQPNAEIELIRTTDPAIGGSDTIEGNEDDDIILGGAYGDYIEGNANRDIILGDNGLLDYVLTSVDSSEPDTSTLDLIIATFPNDGGSDMILCGSENDIAFGGTIDDIMYGNEGNDLMFGDHARVERKPDLELNLSTLPVPTFYFVAIFTAFGDGGDGDLMYGNEGDDIMLGQQGDDDMFGNEDDDDMIGGHNVVGGIDELGATSSLNDMMDGGSEDDVLSGDNAIILRRYDTISPRIRALNGKTLYDDDDDADVDSTHQPNPSGARGRDITMLDHSDSPTPRTYGNDYMAGGPHEDVMFGQLGDDLMQGDSSVSEFISATDPSIENSDDGDDYMEGNGDKDLIYGNYGQDDILGGSSDLFGLTSSNLRPDDSDIIFGGAGTRVARNDPGDESDDGHALDSDVILGDNANIYRVVGTNKKDSGDFLAFTYDNYGNVTIIPRTIHHLDYTPGGDPSDIGNDDLIHGEASDDLIHGMTGNDVIFGEAQDDDIYGLSGHDRIYGGTGQDGILGDDGRIWTSRNGEKETLYGLNSAFKEKKIKLPGPFIGAWVDIEGRLKKVADLQVFFVGYNDTLYGGLGNDWMHGGAGDDGMSGAEALPVFYHENPVTNTTPLPFDPVTRKISFYDAENPRTKITGFFLNFEHEDGLGNKIYDGKDRMFGDPGHDWIVGGTMNDRLFGGLGDDVINADDNHDSQGGLNNEPDSPEYADRDFVFGGAGLDVMIFNTGGDRIFDWIGEFNSYIAPYAPFGYPETDRLISPHTVRFLMAFGEAAGADQALEESDGELGLADQKDPRWGYQHGGPRDPQAGNLPATHRDVMGEPEDDR
jgi:Ca2+-binding RTX toxin-like protein